MQVSDYNGYPGGLSEAEIPARLTIEEKRQAAEPSLLQFPHLAHGILDNWLREHGSGPTPGTSLSEKTEALLDRCEELVRSGENPEALNRYVYGHFYPANLLALSINPEDLARRRPFDEWDDMYGIQ